MNDFCSIALALVADAVLFYLVLIIFIRLLTLVLMMSWLDYVVLS